MPEGDAVRRTCAQLESQLAGHRLTVAELRWPSVAGHDLRATSVVEVAAYLSLIHISEPTRPY
jgi:endonuclease-8